MPNITIDSNVFCWLFDCRVENNGDGHVHTLLGGMISRSFRLHADKGGFIRQEYEDRVRPLICSKAECLNEVQLLRYFMDTGNCDEVDLDPHKALATALRKALPGSTQSVDRRFVLVACVSGTHLISNNTRHINNKKLTLKACARRCGHSLTILSSREALAHLQNASTRQGA